MKLEAFADMKRCACLVEFYLCYCNRIYYIYSTNSTLTVGALYGDIGCAD